MKKALTVILAVLLLAALLASTALADAGLQNFTEKTPYNGRFVDVPQTAWYYGDVAKATSFGLIRGMTELKEQGKSKEEVIAWGEATKLKIVHRFMVDDLQWLRRGGRLSNAATIVGSLLSIKPLIYLPDDGSLVAYEKVRGRKKAISRLLESTEKDIGDTTGKQIILSHSDCEEDGLKWLQTVQERYPAAEVTLQELGPVIGSHIGPGFLSIVYLADKRIP